MQRETLEEGSASGLPGSLALVGVGMGATEMDVDTDHALALETADAPVEKTDVDFFNGARALGLWLGSEQRKG